MNNDDSTKFCSIVDESGAGHIVAESDYYYEPTIKASRNDYRGKMREYLKEPNEYSNQYGKWCALNVEQRQLIRRLLDEMDSADVVIKKQNDEKQQLISFLEDKIRELNYNIYKYDTWHELGENKEFMKLQVGIYQEILDFVNKGGRYE